MLAGLDSRDLRAKVCLSVRDAASLRCTACVVQDGLTLMQLKDYGRAWCNESCLQYGDTGVALHSSSR